MAVQRDKVIASAEKLVAKGKIEPAIKEYERLLDDNPNDVNTLNRIGDLWVRINRNDEAVNVFSKIADHYSKDGFFLKAIAIYKKINKLDPSKLDIYARLADLYAKQGLAMEAKSQYQVLADYYLKHGEPGNALTIYRKISELDPQSINVHVKLADLYSANNQPAEALKEYDRVGRMLLKRGMLDEAVHVFRKALKADPRNTELVESLVNALVEARDFENASQIVQTALETNRENARLLAMLGKIQLARGDGAGARATLERALAADPNETSVREALADLYLSQGDADRALEMLSPVVERALGRNDRTTAIDALNRIIRVDPGHPRTLDRLVAVYNRLNEETNVLASMNSLAEAFISRTRFDEAARVLENLIQREPQNAQHRTKLQFVRSQMGGVDTLPPRTAPPPVMPAMEIEEPTPSFDMTEEADSSFGIELDSSAPLDLDFGASVATPAPVAAPAPAPPPQHLMPAVEIAAADLAQGGSDDLDFITEHLTEAEVFAKYGLAEKAAEHLRAVLERAPNNVTAHERLFRVLLDEGDNDAARDAARDYVRVLEESGDKAGLAAVENEFLARGQHFHVTPPRAVSASPPQEEPAEITIDDISAGETEITFDLEPPTPDAIELETPPAEPDDVAVSIESEQEIVLEPAEEASLAFEPAVEAPPELEPVEEAVDVMGAAEEIVEEPEPIEEIAEEPAVEEIEEVVEEPPLSFEPEPEPVSEIPMAETPFEAEPVEDVTSSAFEPSLDLTQDIEPPAEPFFGVEATATDELPIEDVAEVDFYIEHELFDEARRKLDALTDRYPGNPELAARHATIESAATAATASAPRPPVLSRDEIETELLSAIPDEEEELPAPMPPSTPAPPPVALVEEGNLFADEDNFFDLAAELESELSEEEESVSLSEEEQSLEEIFKEFKKGVEQQLDSEDYDTHYNLGIAYKEMGLIDEAIGEFQLASKDPKRAVECASMLGLCFLEKGMPQLAIKWYRKGLEMPEISEDEHVGLLYDLASAYQEVGDTENAQKAFMEVYGMNSNYRDIVGRIKQLEDARK